jgi:fatty acid hydroxylase family protein
VSFTLFDQNVLMLLYIYLTAQLQHSEIWIPFTGFWGRMFISPARHQLHHSADPAHFNCNMGASLAIWDWLAGSSRMPSVEPPGLAFGVSGLRHGPHGVMGLVIGPGHQRTEGARQRERLQAYRYGGGLRTPFGGPRWPARRRFQSLIASWPVSPRC